MKGVGGVILALLQSEQTQGNISSLFSCLSDNANILKQFWGLSDITSTLHSAFLEIQLHVSYCILMTGNYSFHM